MDSINQPAFIFLGLAEYLYCLPIPSAAIAGPVLLLPCSFALAKKKKPNKKKAAGGCMDGTFSKPLGGWWHLVSFQK